MTGAGVLGRRARKAGSMLLRGDVAGVARAVRDEIPHARRRVSIRLASPAGLDRVRVYYGFDRLPSRDDLATGGIVKFQPLQDQFPNATRDFNLLYLGSSSLPLDADALIRLARRRGALIVWNQNGVRYPGGHGQDYDVLNRRRARALHEADHVLFQSEFCKLAADRFLGERRGSWEVLHNGVDTRLFTPASAAPNRLTLLLGGARYLRYAFDLALRAFALVAADRPDATLLVTGRFTWASDPAENEREARRLVAELGLTERVDFLGGYTQRQAPEVFRRASVLIHPKYNDCCPSVVIEAMACGLPVVYSASGGVPELVGEEAGIGVPAPLDFERLHPPDPTALAAATLKVADALEDYREAARERASERFDVRPWLRRHGEVFEQVLAKRRDATRKDT